MKFAHILARPWSSTRVYLHFTIFALAVFFAAVTPVRPQNAPKTHIVRVKFDYNFKRFHGCKKKNKGPCLQEFNVYNVTRTGKRFLLFSIPAPPGAKGEVQGITGASKPLVFVPGQHMIAVTAETDLGAESDPHGCFTMVDIAPEAPSSPPQPKK